MVQTDNDHPIEFYWQKAGFTPNDSQRRAIQHVEGPLFITAGPGSGKTRVLLWRTMNLIVFHGVKPEEIFLSTFTEKAAKQLQDGLRNLLGMVTNETARPFDISRWKTLQLKGRTGRSQRKKRQEPDTFSCVECRAAHPARVGALQAARDRSTGCPSHLPSLPRPAS